MTDSANVLTGLGIRGELHQNIKKRLNYVVWVKDEEFKKIMKCFIDGAYEICRDIRDGEYESSPSNDDIIKILEEVPAFKDFMACAKRDGTKFGQKPEKTISEGPPSPSLRKSGKVLEAGQR